MVADPADVSDAQAGFDRLLRSVLQRLQADFGHRLSAEDLLTAAKRAVDGIRLEVGGYSWESAIPCTVEQAQRVDRLRQGIRLVGTIVERTAPQMVIVEGADGAMETEATSIRIADATRQSIWSLDLLGAILLDKVHDYSSLGRPIEFLAIPIALPVAVGGTKLKLPLDDSRKNFFMAVLDVRPSEGALDSLSATKEERERVSDRLAAIMISGQSPLDYLVDNVIEIVRVAGLEQFPLLRELIHFTCLQALSWGYVDSASARLHGVIIGPPGRGKKLIGLCARILNPICAEMSPSKASPAGLVGTSHHNGSGWVSTPGLLARASCGVGLLQDAHGWSPIVVQKIAPILQEVIEDGVVRDSVAGGTTRDATCALLLDLNRRRHVGGTGAEAAILGVRPLISRLDLVVEIPDDAAQAWAVGRSMVDQIGRGGLPIDRDPRVRDLRLLVAMLRDTYPRIDLDPARAAMASAYDAIADSNANILRDAPESGDIPARLTISMARYISAAARGRGSDQASAADVEVALRFLGHKMSYLRMHRPATSRARPPTPADWVADHPGGEVRSDDMAAAYANATGQSSSERTMRRHILARGGRRTGPGRYLLPPGPDGHPDSGLDGGGE